LALLHGGVELERHAEGIDRLERAPLVGALDELVPQPLRPEEVRGLVEVLLVADLESHMVRERFAALSEHERVMLALLHGPQIERVPVLVLEAQAERAGIEVAGATQVSDAQRNVACAHDVERRIEDVLGHGHSVPPSGAFLRRRASLVSPWRRTAPLPPGSWTGSRVPRFPARRPAPAASGRDRSARSRPGVGSLETRSASRGHPAPGSSASA